MKNTRRYSTFFFLCLSIACFTPGHRAIAQGTFAYRGSLDTVKADGFYRIILTPELVAKCRPDLGDLRILDAGKRFVSYALKDSQEARMPTTGNTITEEHIEQKDSNDKHSYVRVNFSEAYSIDWIGFVIHNPVFFKRKITVLTEGSHPGEWATVVDADIDPEKKLFRIPTIRTRLLRIDISNADNAPLEIANVTCFQTTRYLVAYLRAGNVYQLLTGNAQATAPDYDLKYFTDSLKTTPELLNVRSLQRIGGQDQPATISSTETRKETTTIKDHSGLLLWSCLLAVLLFLVYFSVRMVKAIAKKDAHDRL